MKLREILNDAIIQKFINAMSNNNTSKTEYSIVIYYKQNNVPNYLGQIKCFGNVKSSMLIKAISDCDVEGIEYRSVSPLQSFRNWKSVYAINILINIDSALVDGMLVCDDTLMCCCDPMIKNYRIPDTVTKISDDFKFPSTIETIDFNNVAKVPDEFCRGFVELKHINIGSATHIGCNAFRECTSLSDVFIPDSVNTIGSKAFYIFNRDDIPKNRRISISKDTKFCDDAFFSGELKHFEKPTAIGVEFRQSEHYYEQKLEEMIRCNRKREAELIAENREAEERLRSQLNEIKK